MPIEFKCQGCGKALRVPDDAAGKKVKCPACSQVATIPSAADPNPLGEIPSFSSPPMPTAAPPSENPFADPPAQSPMDQGNPYQSPQAISTPQQQFSEGNLTPTRLDLGAVFANTFSIIFSNLPMLLACCAVLGVVNSINAIISHYTVNPWFAYMWVQFVENITGRQVLGVAPVDLPIWSAPVLILLGLVGMWLYVGFIKCILGMSRRQSVSLSTLFSGGPVFLAYLGLSLVTGIATGFGFLLFIVPGVILSLMWLLADCFVIDKKMGIGESLSASNDFMKRNKGTAFLIFLIAILCVIVFDAVIGFGTSVIMSLSPALVLPVTIGNSLIQSFTTVPFMLVLSVVAYLSATGQTSLASENEGQMQ